MKNITDYEKNNHTKDTAMQRITTTALAAFLWHYSL